MEMSRVFVLMQILTVTMTSGRTIKDACLNNTLTLNDSCLAQPVIHEAFHTISNRLRTDLDTSLLILYIRVKGPHETRAFIFNILDTEYGETMLHIKSEMEFLTDRFPVLARNVIRHTLSLEESNSGCFRNFTTDVIKKRMLEWLLCKFTRNASDGELYLSIRKVCFRLSEDSEIAWQTKLWSYMSTFALFHNLYTYDCCDKPLLDQTCSTIQRNQVVHILTALINYGVSVLGVIVSLFVVHITFPCIRRNIRFLYTLKNENNILIKHTQTSKDHSLIKLKSQKRWLWNSSMCLCNTGCSEEQETHSCLLTHHLKTKPLDKTYLVLATGVWVQMEDRELVTHDNLSFVNIWLADIFSDKTENDQSSRNALMIGFLSYTIVLIMIPTVLAVRMRLPLMSGLDFIIVGLLLLASTISFVMFFSSWCSCKCSDKHLIDKWITLIKVGLRFACIIIVYVIFVHVIRLVALTLLGIELQVATHLFRIYAAMAMFFLVQLYNNIEKVRKSYTDYLVTCMDIITSDIFKLQTLDHDLPQKAFTNKLLLEPNDISIKEASTTFQNRLPLFFYDNGEPAIPLKFFLAVLHKNIYPSPGKLKHAILICLLKTLGWSIFVGGIMLALYFFGDRQKYKDTSVLLTSVGGGLLPVILRSLLFKDDLSGIKWNRANITRSIKDVVNGVKDVNMYISDYNIKNQGADQTDEQSFLLPSEEEPHVYVQMDYQKNQDNVAEVGQQNNDDQTQKDQDNVAEVGQQNNDDQTQKDQDNVAEVGQQNNDDQTQKDPDNVAEVGQQNNDDQTQNNTS